MSRKTYQNTLKQLHMIPYKFYADNFAPSAILSPTYCLYALIRSERKLLKL